MTAQISPKQLYIPLRSFCGKAIVPAFNCCLFLWVQGSNRAELSIKKTVKSVVMMVKKERLVGSQ